MATEIKELLKGFNALLDTHEMQNENWASFIHGEILPVIFMVNHKLIRQSKNAGEGNLDFDEEMEMLTNLSQELRVKMYELFPSILKQYGLAKALNSFINKLNEKEGQNINLKSYSDENVLPFSAKEQLNIYRVILLVMEHILNVARTNKMDVSLSTTTTSLLFVFKAKKNKRVRLKVFKRDVSERTIESHILSRLYLLNADIRLKPDWCGLVIIAFPFTVTES